MRGYPEHLHEVINEDLQESIYDEQLCYGRSGNMKEDCSQYYNKGNDCDACKNQYLHGIDGDRIGCKCYDDRKECEFVERIE